jgi:hypothetical protein
LIGKDGCIYQSQIAWTTDLNLSIDDSHHIVYCFHAAWAKRVVSPTSGTDSCLVFLEGDVSVLVRSHDRSFVARIHGSERRHLQNRPKSSLSYPLKSVVTASRGSEDYNLTVPLLGPVRGVEMNVDCMSIVRLSDQIVRVCSSFCH